jgi:hypothetical protein
MTGYVKIFQSILGSSIWHGKDSDLRVWIAMLVLKGQDHIVRTSVLGLANLARVSPELCREALERFLSPDPDSTSKEHEGRKITALPEGGWLVLNGDKYAKMLSYESRKEYNRQKMAEWRAQNRGGKKGRRKKKLTEGSGPLPGEIANQALSDAGVPLGDLDKHSDAMLPDPPEFPGD